VKLVDCETSKPAGGVILTPVFKFVALTVNDCWLEALPEHLEKAVIELETVITGAVTVTVLVAEQPVVDVNVITEVPPVTPDTRPELLTVATAGVALDQVPV
jgi:hypothetical protein